MTTRNYTFTNATLLSGSRDAFRTALGGSWQSVASEDDSSFVELEAPEFDAADLPNNFIDKIEYNADLIDNISDTVVNPSKRVPIRIFGTSGSVKNSKHWETIFLGGTFGEETINPIFSEDVFEKTYFEYETPYTKREEKEMSDLGLSSIQISYEYNSYLPSYENWVKDQSSELLIPNYCLLTDLQGRDLSEGSSDLELYDSQIISYTTREGQYQAVGALYKLNKSALWQIGFDSTEANSSQLQEKNKRYTNLATTYLTPAIELHPLSSSTTQYIENRMKNIYLDASSLDRIYTQKRADSEWSRKKFPFYVKIDFPLDDSAGATKISSMFEDENYSARFLKVLKEAFMGELDTADLKTNSNSFNVMGQHKQKSDEITEEISAVNESDYNTVDFEKMLFYMYNNYKSVSNDGLFIGANDISRQACFDTTGSYRHFNSIAAAGVIGRFHDALEAITNWSETTLGPLEEIYGSTGSLNTTLAYRIQKVGGTPSGDSRAQNTLQNYWFTNTDSMEDFTLIDTQVKYGTDYTYNVYAYVLTVGKRYKLSNLLLTHQMAFAAEQAASDQQLALEAWYEQTEWGGAVPDLYGAAHDDKWGVEFYDPSTGDVADQLYYTDADGISPDPDPVDNEFATGAHSWVSAPYVADAYLEYEFYPLIVEVPITSKTLKILDNPANATNVFPYQHSNASNKIGFGLYYDTFSQKSVPEALSSTDVSLRAAYANANDLLEGEKILLGSVSRPRFVEIYRIAYKPTSRTDFAGGLISTIDLKISDYKTPENIFTGDVAPHSTYTYTNTFFDEKIRTNQDYYYLFRILNEQRSLAQWSDIYKVNLVDDGGFVYSLFDTFFESDLEENTFVTPSKDIKKLIHLPPSEWHMDLNTATADFNETAQSQLRKVFAGSADDLIWGKTFKVRLTSKKTGKKIDLNITYNLNRE